MSTECVKNNTCSPASDLYERNAVYLQEDILNVCKLEDEEQLRRIADKEGENNKRVLANNLSVMFGENLRATWFQRGSSFVLSLLGNMRSAVAHTASDLSATVSNKAGDLGHKASIRISSTAEDVGVKAQGVVYDMSNTISNKAGEVGLKAQEKAHQLSDSIAHKAGETASSVSSQAQAAALNLKEKSLETASSVSLQAQAAALNLKEKSLEKAHSVGNLAHEKALDLFFKLDTAQGAGRSWLSEKTQEYASKFRDAVKLSFYKNLGSVSGHTNKTFAMLEEEAERARRMNCSDEEHAINNAMKLALLVKGLNGGSCDPHIHFSTRLLEEGERSRRICEDQCDKAAITNAKSVSELICQKFSAQEQLSLKKAEIKSELNIQEIKKPFAAAM